jgi:tetratricopeptide (TPR) repeat protein
MPRLTPLQWLLVAAFLGFYGFAVFALTRDYYMRHPPRFAGPPAASQAPHALPGQAGRTFAEREVLAGSAAPAQRPTGNDPQQLNRAGDELFGQRRYDEAIPYYRRALELEPDDPDASNDLGLALHYTGQSAEAVRVLRAGAERSPDFQRIWLTLGFVSANAGDEAAARESLEKARALDPENGIGREAARLLGLLEGG